MWSCTSRNIGQISNILCQLLVCSGKSQLSNYANANYLKNVDMDLVYVVSCQDYFMSWHTDIRYIVAALLEIRLKVVIWLWWVTDRVTDVLTKWQSDRHNSLSPLHCMCDWQSDRRTDKMTEWQTQQFISTSLHVCMWYWEHEKTGETTIWIDYTTFISVDRR